MLDEWQLLFLPLEDYRAAKVRMCRPRRQAIANDSFSSLAPTLVVPVNGSCGA
jgi:hypothetical protein